MKRLGRVLRITSKGLILVKTDIAPPIETRVLDSKGRLVGWVYDVFGPVKSPYVLIKPSGGIDEIKRMLKSGLYISSEVVRRGRKWRKMKRK